MSSPREAPAALAELCKNLSSRPMYDFTRSTLAELAGTALEKVEDLSRDELIQASSAMGTELAEGFVETLNTSAIYYCDREMTSVVASGALTLDDTDISDTSIVPEPEGFCYFEGGIQIYENIVVHALCWKRLASDAYSLLLFNDGYSYPDFMADLQFEQLKKYYEVVKPYRWTMVTSQSYFNEVSLNPMAKYSSEKLQSNKNRNGGIDEVILSGKLFHSFLLMLQQPPELLEAKKIKPTNKSAVKRLEKSGVRSEVIVLDLRHKTLPSSGGGSERPFSGYNVRWMVSGHWRWQPMKDKITKEKVVKRIWISPYMKGPEDKPFVARKVVKALLK